jgi:hypothetical protein
LLLKIAGRLLVGGKLDNQGGSCQGAKGAASDQTQLATNNFRVMHLCTSILILSKQRYNEAFENAVLFSFKAGYEPSQLQGH